MTAQTTAYLKATEFTLTGLVGRITPQNMVDTVDTMAARSSSPINVTLPEYGAIGDGLSHPLSSISVFQGLNSAGWTLTQWRAVFSFATATTNEINWCAVQLAINTAHASSTGGTVYSPSGRYIYCNSSSASDGSGTVVFPETGTTDPGTLPLAVNWVGDGFSATLHQWPFDLGTGHFAVSCTNRLNTVAGSVGSWHGMSFFGPSNSVALGAKPANMHGLGWAEYRLMTQLRVSGFNGGYCVNSGGQTQFDTIFSNYCFYGMYFDAPNATGDGGDLTIKNFSAGNCTQAGIGIGANTQIISTIFIKPGVFTTPFGIYKETGGSNNVMLEDVEFLNPQFEQIGNCVLSDGLTFGSHLGDLKGAVRFRNIEIWGNSGYRLAALNSSAVFQWGQNFGLVEIDMFYNQALLDFANWPNGLFEVNVTSAKLLLRCDLGQLFGQMSGVCNIGANSNIWSDCNFYVESTSPQTWSGKVFPANGNPSLALGNVLRLSTDGARKVELAQGTTTEVIVGICCGTHNGVSNGAVVVADHGYMGGFVTAGANVIANGSLVRATTNGLVITSSGQFQTTSKNLGQWQFGSGSSPNFVGQLYLQGLL